MDGAGARFGLLGPVEVTAGNRLVDIGAARQRCVLAVLLLDANRGISVDQLIERVWGGRRLPERPRKAAQIYVSLLRTALAGIDGVAIVRRPDGYLIELDERCVDVHAFRRSVDQARACGEDDRAAGLFERALGMWRGEVFGELDTPWLADVRASLNQQRHTVERDLTDVQLRRGRHGLVLAQLSLWAREHPLDERLAGQLMLALFRSGRQADALDAYRRVRERLADELGTGPGHALHELHQRILTDDPSLDVGPVSIRSVVPRQLPAAPRWFTGRRAEVDSLLGDSESGTGGVVVISAIDGMAGVGKTALAVHTAHRLAGRFPDGQLFVDLHGYTEGCQPRTSGEALDRLLCALGVPPERIPHDVEDRAALYRQRLADTRTLIVLDNATDEAQVRPLLPGGSGCLVLVTSRRRLKGLDSRTLSLDVLPSSDALALVEAVTGRELPELAEITELCGRLPLALRIAAALLRHRPAWSAALLAGLLRDQHQRVSTLSDGERDLGAVFALSYRSLDDARQRFFRLLGLIPGPDTDAHAAAALAGTDQDTAARELEGLVDHNLLIPHAPGRYRMHDLIRLHARALAHDDPDRDAALERLLDHYQHTANRADSLVTRFPGPEVAGSLPDADAAWAWLRAERANLLAALRHAIVRDHAERIVALTAGLATLLHVDGPWTEAISLHIMATAAARHVGDRPGQARALTWLGDVRGATGDFSGAIRDLRDALHLSRDMADHRAQANALTRLGQIRGFTGDHSGAIRDLRQALELCQRLGERRGQSNALTMLGQIRGMSGDLPSAAHDLRAALDLARDLGDRRGQANALNRLGQIQRRTGDYRGALRDLHDALNLHRHLGDRTGEAVALACIGEVRGLLGDHPAAIRDLCAALDLFQRLGERHGQANTLTMLGQIRGRTGDHPGAIRDLRTGLDLFRRTGAHGNEVWALNHYATVLAATGNRPQALTIHHDALDQARRTHQPEHEATALEGIGECHLRTGDTETGRTHLKQALEIFQRLAMAPDADRVQSRLAQLALRSG
ncbi:MAG TPA: tetratricopeptide repeat protein [Pseudonocardiaceae bacterium]|nr:tetratricopeptide repeat protein [Pseudonocardiaceae bacterium]